MKTLPMVSLELEFWISLFEIILIISAVTVAATLARYSLYTRKFLRYLISASGTVLLVSVLIGPFLPGIRHLKNTFLPIFVLSLVLWIFTHENILEFLHFPHLPSYPSRAPEAYRCNFLKETGFAEDENVVPGSIITYTIHVDNSQNRFSVSNIVIDDPLPLETVFKSASDKGTYNDLTHTVSWFLNDLPAGQKQSISVVVLAKPEIAPETIIINSAHIDYETNGRKHLIKKVESKLLVAAHKKENVGGRSLRHPA